MGKRLSIVGALTTLLLLVSSPTLAVSTSSYSLNSSTWTDLGAGPMELYSSGAAVYAISDSDPGSYGTPLTNSFIIPNNFPATIQSTSHMWAKLIDPGVGSAFVAPISAWGGTLTWPGSAAPTSYGTTPSGTVPAVNAYITNPSTLSWPGTATLTSYGTTPSGTVPAVNANVTNSLAVTGTFYQATQPVSLASLPALATGANTIGNVGITNSVAVTGTFYQATQPVSLAALPALATGANTIGNVGITTGSNSIGTVGLNTGSNTVGKIDILGNSGATLDSTIAAGSAPTNGIAVLGQYNSSAPTLTNAQAAALQVTSAGSLHTTIDNSLTLSWPGTATVQNYGTPPGSGTVPAVNAYVTNTNANITPGDAITTGTFASASPTLSGLLLWNGTTYDRATDDASKYLQVNCKAGCSATSSITGWAGGTLGAMANYGTSPGAVLVPGVNAFITNTVPVTLSANQSVNVAQVNGHNVVEATTSGVQKVGIVGNAGAALDGATGAAAPANALQVGVTASGATGGQMRGIISCDNHVFKHITTATDTLATQGVASQTIYICGWRSRAAGVATWYLENTASANANCSSTLTQITGVATEAANTGEIMHPGFWSGLKNTSGNGLCINSTGTGGVDIDIWYTQF